MIAVSGLALVASIAQAAEKMKPFVLAWSSAGEMAALVSATEDKLRAGDFEVVGTNSPYPGTTLIAVTSDKLKSVAGLTEAGGYAAAQRVSLWDNGGVTKVYRIAINFPDLSMMGSNSFMSIMGAPDQIEYALTLVAGGTPKKN